MKKNIEASEVVNDLFESIIKDIDKYLKELSNRYNRLGDALKTLDFEKSSELCSEMMLILGAIIPLRSLLEGVQIFQEAYKDKEHKFN